MNATSKPLSIALGLAAVLAVGCGTQTSPSEEARSDKQRLAASGSLDDVRALTAGGVAFSCDLLGKLEPGKNLFFSPHSIELALAMTYAGAAGATKTAMAQTLHFAQPDATLHQAWNTLDQALASRGQGALGADGQPFRLKIANAVWAQQGYALLPTYLDRLAESYGAGVRLVDFVGAAEPARVTINDWVSVQTEGKIPELLAQGFVNADTRLVLTNTVYFNAAWATPFEASRTAPGSFTLPSGGTVSVPLMHGGVRGGYAEGSGWKAAEFDYDGREVSFVAIVPEAGTFATFASALDGNKLGAILGALQTGYEVVVTMPKLELRTRASLSAPLAELGMGVAFSDAADFSGMNGTGGLQIQDVVHEAFVKVDENGTEAAAATAVGVGTTSVPEQRSFEANKPFLFALRDKATGALLFVGRVLDPTAK